MSKLSKVEVKRKIMDKKWRKFWLRVLTDDQGLISYVISEYEEGK